MNNKYERIMRAIYGAPWAILEEKLEEIMAFIDLKAAGGSVNAEVLAEFKAMTEAASARSVAKSAGGVQVIPMLGVISHRANMLSEFSGGTSTEKFCQAFRAAVSDPGVKAIVLDCDSPGGMVDGIFEAADEIASAKGRKPVIAVANCMMASAAYCLGSQASELVVTPSGLVGSIGVLAKHVDDSELQGKLGLKTTLIRAGKYKAEEQQPLTDDALAHMQSLVDGMYDQFVKAVARGRGTSQSAVRDGFGQGRVVNAQQAVKLGMADRVATLDQVLAEMGVARPLPSQRSQPLQSPAVVIPARGEVDPPRILLDSQCACACDACMADNCAACSMLECDDPNCEHGADAKAEAKVEPPPQEPPAHAIEHEARRRQMEIAGA